MSGFSRSWFSNGGGGYYRAVGNRCAVDLGRLPIVGTDDEKRAALEAVGCTVVSVDPIALARSCIGRSSYRRGARASEAPGIVDCSSFTKWVFGQCGIWIPRRSIQQRDYWGNGGRAVNDSDDVRPGDLVFTSGFRDYYDEDPAGGVGHVGIATADRTVVHAANSKLGVTESPIEPWLTLNDFRGARRMLSEYHPVLTLETPPDREVETEDDFRWMIRQRMT
jgi:hypothetical protein